MSDNQPSLPKCAIASIAKTVVTMIVLATIIASAIKLAGQTEIAASLGSGYFVLAVLLAVLYRAVNPLGWVLVLRGLGHNVHALAATNIWLTAESRRWLPGGVWGYATRAMESKKLGVPAPAASASMLVELIITIAAAVLVSTFGLLLFYNELKQTAAHLIIGSTSSTLTLNFAAVTVVCFGCITYLFRTKLASKFKSLSSRWQSMQSVDLSGRALATALAYFVAMACLNGIVNLVLLRAFSDVTVPMVVMISATAAAWIVGYLAFFSPGGLFVREAALATLLLPWVPYPIALALAGASRIAQLVAEVICMLPGLLSPPTQHATGASLEQAINEGVSLS